MRFRTVVCLSAAVILVGLWSLMPMVMGDSDPGQQVTLAELPGSLVLSRSAQGIGLAAGPCDGLVTTPYFTQYYGSVRINGTDAPAGTLIEMYSPREDRVGCYVTTVAGIYPYTRVYGEDNSATPPIPGMRAGEAVTFKVNGVVATTNPATVLWQNDRVIHQVDLTASAAAGTPTATPTGTSTPPSVPTATPTATRGPASCEGLLITPYFTQYYGLSLIHI